MKPKVRKIVDPVSGMEGIIRQRKCDPGYVIELSSPGRLLYLNKCFEIKAWPIHPGIELDFEWSTFELADKHWRLYLKRCSPNEEELVVAGSTPSRKSRKGR